MSHMSQFMSLSLCLSRFLSQCLTSVSTRPIEKNGAQSQSGWKRASVRSPKLDFPVIRTSGEVLLRSTQRDTGKLML